jgi:hypothetical protein
MKINLKNVRCRFCHKLYARKKEDSGPMECIENECLKSRRFVIAGIQSEGFAVETIQHVRTALRDRSQKPMYSYE